MTDKFPDLTVENVKRWYYESDPKWSVSDISRVLF